MLYEISNPSDSYTIEAKSLDVAFVACILLGNGQYAFEALEDGAEDIPLFMFGGHDAWSQKHFVKKTEDVLMQVTSGKLMELADCFDSCLIGRPSDRKTYLAGLELIDDPAKREIWRARWHDVRRSSMNDIGGRAYAMAKKLREGELKQEPVPQQVFTK